MKKRNNISIVEIGKIVGRCYDEFEDAWVSYNQDIDKIQIICAIHQSNLEQNFLDNLKSKIGVNIAREYGTQFVENFCDISIINYL